MYPLGNRSRFSRENVEEYITNIDSAISKSVIDKDMVLYRGIHPHVADDLLKTGGRENLGFTSTTYDPKEAIYFMKEAKIAPTDWNNLIIIRKHKGSKGLYVNAEEAEIILPRNLKYKVTRVVESDSAKLGDARAIDRLRLIYVEEI